MGLLVIKDFIGTFNLSNCHTLLKNPIAYKMANLRGLLRYLFILQLLLIWDMRVNVLSGLERVLLRNPTFSSVTQKAHKYVWYFLPLDNTAKLSPEILISDKNVHKILRKGLFWSALSVPKDCLEQNLMKKVLKKI